MLPGRGRLRGRRSCRIGDGVAKGPVVPSRRRLAALVAGLAVLVPGCAPQGTTADWTAEERALDEDERGEFDAFCRQASRQQHAGPELVPDDAELVVASRRGRLMFGIYGRPDGGISDCNLMIGPPGSEHLTAGGAGLGTGALGPLDRHLEVQPALPAVDSGDPAGSGQALYGRASSDVDAVRVLLDDDHTVVARQQDGYWLAWWPLGCGGRVGNRTCSPSVVEVIALDSAGEVLGQWTAR